MKTVPTYTASIYVGSREQYTQNIRAIDMARECLHNYVNQKGLCVTLTPTEYIYTGKKRDDGSSTEAREPGFVVGLINYPRFPAEVAMIRERALEIAQGLLALFKQFKVTVVFPDETVMIESDQDL